MHIFFANFWCLRIYIHISFLSLAVSFFYCFDRNIRVANSSLLFLSFIFGVHNILFFVSSFCCIWFWYYNTWVLGSLGAICFSFLLRGRTHRHIGTWFSFSYNRFLRYCQHFFFHHFVSHSVYSAFSVCVWVRTRLCMEKQQTIADLDVQNNSAMWLCKANTCMNVFVRGSGCIVYIFSYVSGRKTRRQ